MFNYGPYYSELQASFRSKILQPETDDERVVEFLTALNVIVYYSYARLLSMNSEALGAWKHCWDHEITFLEEDKYWKSAYDEIIKTVIDGKRIGMKDTVHRCHE